MSLSNAVFKSGATWAPTGGTDVTLAPDGRAIINGLSLVVTADTSLLTRRSVIARATMPALAPSAGAFARMGKTSLVYTIPYLAADGKIYSQSVKIDASFHPEYTGKAVVIGDIAALTADSDFASFWLSSLLT